MKSSVAVRPDTKTSDLLAESLPAAVEVYPLADTDSWQPLADLSSQTLFEGLTVDPDAIVVQGKQYIAPGRVYVRLQYDPHSPDPVLLDESYPVRITFHLDGVGEREKVMIDSVEPDTSSFYT